MHHNRNFKTYKNACCQFHLYDVIMTTFRPFRIMLLVRVMHHCIRKNRPFHWCTIHEYRTCGFQENALETELIARPSRQYFNFELGVNLNVLKSFICKINISYRPNRKRNATVGENQFIIIIK